ncbi:MAG: preprotein translocase subunit YajC [Muribaculaceae bacterium]|nr:preprotein translocase subunit YajC [Muribaculaceae bacterium]
MNQLNTLLLQAQAGQGSNWSGLLMIVAMVVIFYFFMIRPQSKKQKEIKQAREAMKNGDRVVTAGGIHGRIKEIKDSTIIMEVAPGVSLKVDKNSVYPVIEEQAKK